MAASALSECDFVKFPTCGATCASQTWFCMMAAFVVGSWRREFARKSNPSITQAGKRPTQSYFHRETMVLDITELRTGDPRNPNATAGSHREGGRQRRREANKPNQAPDRGGRGWPKAKPKTRKPSTPLNPYVLGFRV